MKVGAFVSQILSAAGDPSGDKISREFLMRSITEESRLVALQFPSTRVAEVTPDDNDYLDPGNMRVSMVVVQGRVAKMLMPADMDRVREFGALSGVFWTVYSEGLYVYPVPSSAKVSGDLLPPDWSDLDIGDFDGVDIDSIDGILDKDLMSLVYLRALQRACEAAGAFDRAQYYLSAGERRERDLKRFWEPESTSSLGYAMGHDF